MSTKVIVSLCILAFATGCANTEPMLTIKVDSKPRGAEVFVKNKTQGRLGLPMLVPEWDPVGRTPLTLKWPLSSLDAQDPENHQEVPIVLEADPPLNAKGLYKKRAVCDCATNSSGDSTCVVFFDLTKPSWESESLKRN